MENKKPRKKSQVIQVCNVQAHCSDTRTLWRACNFMPWYPIPRLYGRRHELCLSSTRNEDQYYWGFGSGKLKWPRKLHVVHSIEIIETFVNCINIFFFKLRKNRKIKKKLIEGSYKIRNAIRNHTWCVNDQRNYLNRLKRNKKIVNVFFTWNLK